MILLEKTDVYGIEAAIRGMRNPMQSWNKSDSRYGCIPGRRWPECGEDCRHECEFIIGQNDLKLAKQLVKAGSDHRKFLRQIIVSVDITAPLYWWKEYDTYKVATTANSESTMHTIHKKEFVLDDFSLEHLSPDGMEVMKSLLGQLNFARIAFIESKDRRYWDEIIQLLPSSFNQMRTCTLSFETILNQYHARKDHKLTEWRTYCHWIEDLPWFKQICIEE